MQAHYDFLKRCLVLMCANQTKTKDNLLLTDSVRVAFQLSAAQHVKLMVDTNEKEVHCKEFLGLRMRRPPHLQQCSDSDPYLEGTQLLYPTPGCVCFHSASGFREAAGNDIRDGSVLWFE